MEHNLCSLVPRKTKDIGMYAYWGLSCPSDTPAFYKIIFKITTKLRIIYSDNKKIIVTEMYGHLIISGVC
jgi:hypothetical protein